MIKTAVVMLVLLSVGVSSHAMTVSQEWEKTYNFAHDEALDIQQTTDGGYIVAGIAMDTVSLKILVIKLDSSGNLLWEKTYGGSNAKSASSIQQTIDGGYIITTLEGDILKVDSFGNVIWQNAYNFQQATIQETTDGEYIVAGTIVELFGNGSDIAVTKLDSNGAVIWQKTYGGSGDEGEEYSQFAVPIMQTTDGGYIFTTLTDSFGAGQGDAWVVKLDSEGTIIWQKTYGGLAADTAFSIQEALSGGYIVAGTTYSFGAGEDDAWILKLDGNGDVTWQKVYGGYSWEYAKSIQQTTDGGYVFAGVGSSFSSTDGLWVVKLDSFGNIIWQNTYTERRAGNNAVIQQTIDEGYIVGTNSAGDSGPWDFWVLKLNSNGEIADCSIMASTNASVANTNVIGQNSDAISTVNSFTASPINLDVQNTSASIATLCYYEDPNDMDGDGIENTPGGTMASSIFLADGDNCPDMPNGPFLGTCTRGNVGSTCISDAVCGVGGICSMAQEDSSPPQGNGIGDACDCEGNFNCDANLGSDDVSLFLIDTGRNTYNDPCTNGNPCNGDFLCDGSVDSLDVSKFLDDTGRNTYNNPCPICDGSAWCVYE